MSPTTTPPQPNANLQNFPPLPPPPELRPLLIPQIFVGFEGVKNVEGDGGGDLTGFETRGIGEEVNS